MHVLHFIDSLAPGGSERSLAAMAPQLVAAGIRLDVASFSSRPGIQEDLLEAGARLFTLHGRTRRQRVGEALTLIRSCQPDVVHTMLFEADIAGRTAACVARAPVVSTLASVAYGSDHRSSPGLRWWRVVGAHLADAATARTVCRFHAVSQYVATVMGRRLVLPRDRVDVIPRGRDSARLGRRNPERRRTVRALLGVADTTAVVLVVARHEHQKGIDVVLDAWPDIRRSVGDARLLVAGRDGTQTMSLRSRADRLEVSADPVLLGPRDDVADLLCAADVFVLPSRWEGLPGALLEAMALEAPIVASDIPPVREVIGPQHGLLVPPGRPDVLASAVVTALRDADSAGERAVRARQRFEESFTVEAATRGMLAFYDRATRP